MAERNWRDEFEEKDLDGDTVLDVFYHDSKAIGYMIMRNGVVDITRLVSRLTPKPKPKTYRPWTRDEVPVGTVVVHKESQGKYVICGATVSGVYLLDVKYSSQDLLNHYTMLDGTPAGVLES